MHLTAQINALDARLDAVLLQGWWWWPFSKDKTFKFNAGGERWKLVSSPKTVRLYRGGKEVKGLGILICLHIGYMTLLVETSGQMTRISAG